MKGRRRVPPRRPPRRHPGVLANALSPSPDLSTAVQPGLQALAVAHRTQIEQKQNATDSLCFDDVERDSPCFDYLLGVVADDVLAVEVHPATAGELKSIFAKQAATRERLARANVTHPIDRWVWLASGKVDVPGDSADRVRLAERGIQGPSRRTTL